MINDLRLVTIKLDVKFNNHEISKLPLPKVGTISPHSSIAVWEEELIHAELLKIKYHPPSPIPNEGSLYLGLSLEALT